MEIFKTICKTQVELTFFYSSVHWLSVLVASDINDIYLQILIHTHMTLKIFHPTTKICSFFLKRCKITHTPSSRTTTTQTSSTNITISFIVTVNKHLTGSYLRIEGFLWTHVFWSPSTTFLSYAGKSARWLPQVWMSQDAHQVNTSI